MGGLILNREVLQLPVAVGVVNDVIISEPPCWWTAKQAVYGELV